MCIAPPLLDTLLSFALGGLAIGLMVWLHCEKPGEEEGCP